MGSRKQVSEMVPFFHIWTTTLFSFNRVTRIIKNEEGVDVIILRFLFCFIFIFLNYNYNYNLKLNKQSYLNIFMLKKK